MGRLECGPRKAVPLRDRFRSRRGPRRADGWGEGEGTPRCDLRQARSRESRGAASDMRRERLLPDDKTLEKVSRYEAHLSRLMFKAIHELEALQVRRAGGAAPLARLDVDGLPQE